MRLPEQASTLEFTQLLSRLTERLADGPGGKRRVFRDSALGNLGGFFECFKHLKSRGDWLMSGRPPDALSFP